MAQAPKYDFLPTLGLSKCCVGAVPTADSGQQFGRFPTIIRPVTDGANGGGTQPIRTDGTDSATRASSATRENASAMNKKSFRFHWKQLWVVPPRHIQMVQKWALGGQLAQTGRARRDTQTCFRFHLDQYLVESCWSKMRWKVPPPPPV